MDMGDSVRPKPHEQEDASQEGRRMRKVRAPEQPMEEAVEEHARTHAPFRSWCEECVKGKAKEGAHQKRMDDETATVIAVDYGFMGDEEIGAHIMITKDSNTGWKSAAVVPNKGVNDYAVKRLVEDIRTLGKERVVLKSDQEPAILELKKAAKAEYDGELITRESPVGDHQANGGVEKALQGLKFATERKSQGQIGEMNNVFAWLIRHAAYTLNVAQVGHDGKTPYERLKGRPFKKELVPFGECIWYLKPNTDDKTMNEMWGDGICLGIYESSNEVIVGTKEGVIKVRTVRRKANEKDKWNIEELRNMKGTPWEPQPGTNSMKIKTRIIMDEDEIMRPGVNKHVGDKQFRRAIITQLDLKKYGYTKSCEGCRAVLRKAPHATHEDCRQNIETKMKDAAPERYAKQQEQYSIKLAEQVEANVNKKRVLEEAEQEAAKRRRAEEDEEVMQDLAALNGVQAEEGTEDNGPNRLIHKSDEHTYNEQKHREWQRANESTLMYKDYSRISVAATLAEGPQAAT